MASTPAPSTEGLAPLERHLPPEDDVTEGSLLDGFLAYVAELGVDLYPAQEEAILEIFGGRNVILATPTGSGKSMVALAVHFMAVARGKRAFYTAPIKALVSEKFFDLCHALGAENVGMMTGDASVNRDAPVICCTAEILANMALREGEGADVDFVVMDEFHFYSDRDRGVAWQVPLLALPQARFLLMSATLGDTRFFEEGIEALTGVPVALVRSAERPVPLDYEYRLTPLHETIAELLEAGKAPIYIVHFTQRSSVEQAQNLMSVDFLSKSEKQAIKEELRGFRFDSPFGKELRRFVHHGVGVHHAGMLPKYRRMVEKLAQKGMLRIICGTDTLGVGVNVPIRSVLFTKLCKYDGEKTAVLTVRDFQQIAGRAGRKGFDEAGSVVVQAPEHVVENRQLQMKAAGDPKKMRKLRLKKPPDKGYAHWDEGTLEKLRTSPPESLRSSFHVSHAMLLNVLARPEDGCRALKGLIRSSHESPRDRRAHGRTAIAMLRSLRDAGVIVFYEDGVEVNEDLQSDFSLNQALSLYAVEVIGALDPEHLEYPLDVVSVIEAILEDPGAVLYRQVDVLKGRALDAMKAEGMEYEERMAALEKIDHPKPLAELLWATFETFRAHHPWVSGDGVRPKSIAREMYEQGASFVEYVKEYGLARSEGVLLRYLSDAYKALVQNVPETAKTDEVYDLTDWLGAIVRQVDSSLLDEWERLRDPEQVTEVAPEPDGPVDITRDTKAFTALVRNACFRVVRALGRGEYEEAAAMVLPEDPARPVTAEGLAEALAPYYAEHGHIRLDPAARSPGNTLIDRASGAWRVRQILLDPEEHREWYLELRVDLAASAEEGGPVLTLLHLGT